MMIINKLNTIVRNRLTWFEITGVVMRIFSFSMVSWMGPKSPFMFVWIFNTTDALLLTWCALIKKDKAYILLNAFWILVGLVGILRAGGCIK